MQRESPSKSTVSPWHARAVNAEWAEEMYSPRRRCSAMTNLALVCLRRGREASGSASQKAPLPNCDVSIARVASRCDWDVSRWTSASAAWQLSIQVNHAACEMTDDSCLCEGGLNGLSGSVVWEALTGDVSLATSGTASTADTEEHTSRVVEMTRSCSHGSEAISRNPDGRNAQLDEKTCDQPRATSAALPCDVSFAVSGTASTADTESHK